jgi:succinate-acetate transporter protein
MPETEPKNENDEQAARRQTQSQVRIVLRPYASALPLGCFAFAIGNALYSAFLLHWIPQAETRTLATLLIGFVAPLELLPCILAFLCRDTGAASAMGIFGFAWIVQGVSLLETGPGAASVATGIFLLALAVCLAILTAVTIGGKPMLGIMLVVAAVRSVFAALVEFGMHSWLGVTAAALGLGITAIAFYAALGLLLEDVKGIELPMTFRQKDAQAAMQGGLEDQVEHLHREAGVRSQL